MKIVRFSAFACVLFTRKFTFGFHSRLTRIVLSRKYTLQSLPTSPIISVVEDTIRSHLLNNCKLDWNSTLLLCVSGGIDSIAMLHILSNIQKSSIARLNLEVVHFNHKLRPESDEEESFVSSITNQYGYPLHIRHLPIEKRTKVGIQATARDWRRTECLTIRNQILDRKNKTDIDSNSNKSVEFSGVLIATAHHADDQLETSILKLLRGTHISRLYPMLAIDGPFIKPLIPVTKATLIEYLTARELTWREDASNALRTYNRNKVRLDVLPTLDTVGGGRIAVQRRFEELAEQSLLLREWLHTEASKYIQKYPPSRQSMYPSLAIGSDFQSLPPLVQSELVHQLVTQATGHSVSYQTIKRLVSCCQESTSNGTSGGTSTGWVSVSDEWEGAGDAYWFILRPRQLSQHVEQKYFMTENNVNITIDYPKGWGINIYSKSSNETSVINEINIDKSILLSLELYNFPPTTESSVHLMIRNWREGDVIQASWRRGDIVNVNEILKSRGKVKSRLLRQCYPVLEFESKVIAAPPFVDYEFCHLKNNHTKDGQKVVTGNGLIICLKPLDSKQESCSPAKELLHD